MDEQDIYNILEGRLNPKESEKNMYGEVFTPLYLVNSMLDTLEPSVWKNPKYKWYDPACGIGNFPVVIYYRLLKYHTSKHIIDNMLYMNELNATNVKECKRIFKLIDPNASPNITCKDFLTVANQHYDIIVGNPPYNEARNKDTSDQPLYSKFIVKALEMTDRLLFIVPSRWFSGGKGLDEFRKSMLSRKDIVCIHHIPNSRTIWPTVDIKGGVNYFYINKNKRTEKTEFVSGTNSSLIYLDKYDILVPNPKDYAYINATTSKPSIQSLYYSTGYYGINTNDSRLTNIQKTGYVKCHVSANKGSIQYINPKHIKNPYDFWKVATPQGSGKGGDGFGKILILGPSEVASQTYFFFKVDTKSEALSLKSYLETEAVNKLLSLRKIDQHISEHTLAWIPLVPLDRTWTDTKVRAYLHLPRETLVSRAVEPSVLPKERSSRHVKHVSINNKTRKQNSYVNI